MRAGYSNGALRTSNDEESEECTIYTKKLFGPLIFITVGANMDGMSQKESCFLDYKNLYLIMTVQLAYLP